MSILEPGRLDALRQKAQLAKAEIDGLVKSRSSSATGSSSSAARNKKVPTYLANVGRRWVVVLVVVVAALYVVTG